MTRRHKPDYAVLMEVIVERKMKADKTLDIKGLTDPRPKEVTKDVLNMMSKGRVLRVISDDAAARRTIALLCEYSGYSLLSTDEDGGVICFTIQK